MCLLTWFSFGVSYSFIFKKKKKGPGRFGVRSGDACQAKGRLIFLPILTAAPLI